MTFAGFGIRSRLGLITAIAVVGMGLVIALNLHQYRNDLLAERQARTRQVVEIAESEVGFFFYNLAKTGAMSQDTARDAAREALRSMRYGANDYLWINDFDGNLVMHPEAAAMEGKNVAPLTDKAGHQPFAEATKLARDGGQGFVTFLLPKPGSSEPVEKIAFVKAFGPWNWVIGSGIYIDDVDAAFRERAITLVLAGLAVTAVTVLAVWGIGRSIANPVEAMITCLGAIAGRNVTVTVPYLTAGGSIGRMTRSVEYCRQRMVEIEVFDREQGQRLDALSARDHALRRESQSHLEGVVSAAIQSNEAIIVMARMMRDVAEASRQSQAMASAIEEMVASVQQIAANSGQAATAASDAEGAASSGVAAASQAVSSMERIFTAVQDAGGTVNDLVEVSAKINEMVAQIEDIASQTNLLALNATIEAARAGDAGKGFAVVATEVKSLASQTARVTEDIRGRIERLRGEMETVVTAMRQGGEAVTGGRQVVSQLGDSLGNISARVRAVTEDMGEIAAILNQQSVAAGDVARSTHAIADLAAANNREIIDVLRSMDGATAVLNEQVGHFAKIGTARAIVEVAKNDHVTFKRNVVDVLMGRNADLTAEKLSSHEQCRLGKWYASVTDPRIREHPAFAALLDPHRRVHQCGKDALRKAHDHDLDGALESLGGLNDASHDVLALLDTLGKALPVEEVVGG